MFKTDDPKETFLKIRISTHLLSRLKKYADTHNKTVSEIVRDSIEKVIS